MTSDYQYVCSDGLPPDLELLVNSPVLSFDVEGSGVNIGTGRPYGFSLACVPTGAYYVNIGHEFEGLLADDSKLKIAHSAVYDRSMMKKAGVVIDSLCDTMIAAHLLSEASLSLKSLSLVHLGMNVTSFSELPKRLADMTMLELAEYSGPHSVAALMLWPILEDKMARLKLLGVFWDIEMPLVPVLSDMMLSGVAVDANTLQSLGIEFDAKITSIVEALDHWSGRPGMNHNSPDQVADLVFNRLKLPASKGTKKGSRPSVDAKVMEALKGRHPYIGPYLLYKQYQKLKSTYVDSLLKQIVDGRVYGSFNQTGTRTGRLSSSNPNLQNIPIRTAEGKRIRTAFVAPPGYMLVKADYDLLELKVMAHCSQDRALVSAFADGRDVHAETAVRVFGTKDRRRDGKTLNFQIIYGGGSSALRHKFFEAYPQVKKWSDATIREAAEAGYVRTLGGRIRVIPEFYSSNQKLVEHAGREAISTIIQGSSEEIVKVGMANFWRELKGSSARMVLQVHDEIVLEVPAREVADVIRVLREVLPYNELSVPITVSVEVGKNWGSMLEVRSEKY